MLIAQLFAGISTQFEQKSQRIDAALLASAGMLTADLDAADVVHVYGAPPLDVAQLRRLRRPYVAPTAPRRPRFAFGRVNAPAAIAGPLARQREGDSPGDVSLPEAVEDAWFDAPDEPVAPRVIATFSRPAVLPVVEQTLARIGGYRDDVEWRLLDEAPTPADLAGVAVWVDPAVESDDFDGFVAEALARGVMTVAARTPINAQRLEDGRTGLLFPARDANEMTHAILAALFKPEVRDAKLAAARQTRSKFRPRRRFRALEELYQTLKR